ncbi:MAG: UbiD family decarboxylase [Planctomycetota bacterium]|nr:MAG: UbiD family decarboxylase [Planctomycetota bacterium]
MLSPHLADFLKRLQQAEQLLRVEAEVSADLEIAEITRRVAASAGRALLFDNVCERTGAVATGLLASERRVCLALGADSLDAAADQIATHLAASDLPAPRVAATPACQQVIELGRDIDLVSLPLLRTTPDNAQAALGGAWLTTADPETSDPGTLDPATVQTALTPCDALVQDRRALIITWCDRDPLAAHFRAAQRRGGRLPVAIFFGGPPALALLASPAWQLGRDVYAVVGGLADGTFEVATCRTHPLLVPAESELVIEGQLDTSDAAHEARTATLEVEMITHRTGPRLTAQVPGGPADEPAQLRRTAARLALPRLRAGHRAIRKLVCPDWAAGEVLLVAIEKRHAGEPREVAALIASDATFVRLRFLVLVDDDVDLADERQVWQRVASECRPTTDVIGSPHALGDEVPAMLAFDATRPWPEVDRAGRDRQTSVEQIRELVTARWSEYGMP